MQQVERVPQVEQVEKMRTSKNSSTSSKSDAASGTCEVIGSFIGMGMVSLCFGIGVMLAVKTVSSLECCVEELISRK